MTYTVTWYDCASYLRRRGFLIDGEPSALLRRISVDEIKRAVCDHFELPFRVMSDGSAFRAHARPRQVAIYLARQLTTNSMPALGRLFNRDHSTIMYTLERIRLLRQDDRDLDLAIIAIRERLNSGSPWKEER